MTMIAMGSHHFQVMCSGPSTTACSKSKEPTVSLAQIAMRESASANNTTVKEQQQTSASSLEAQGVTSKALASEQTSASSLQAEGVTSKALAFVYGTLKRGFGNHWLIEEQISKKHCRLVGIAQTKRKYPLVCGPFQVPFLLDVRDSGEHVRGELYEVDSHCLGLLDDLEGISKGHYVRCPLTLTELELDESYDPENLSLLREQGHQVSNQGGEVHAEAYFAAGHFTPGLYRAAPHIEAYTEKESATYTRRMHRPQNKTFVEHVHHWIDEKEELCYLYDEDEPAQ